MGKKTIYVKNEELWERAKSIAGVDGLSRLVEEALEHVVTQKQLEHEGLQRIYLPIVPIDQIEEPVGVDAIKESLGFDGKCLEGDGYGVLSVYLTKAGKLIVADKHPHEPGAITGYRVHDQWAELRNDEAIRAL